MENPDAESAGLSGLSPTDSPELVIDGAEAVEDTSESDPPAPLTRGGPPPLPPVAASPSEAPPRPSAAPPPRPSMAPSLPPPPNKNFMLVGGAVLVVLVGVAVFAGLKVGTSLSKSRAGTPAPPATATAAAPSAEPAAPSADPSAPVIAIPTVEFAN
ncbi:MAG: hypothetical protein IPF92_27150 [Myxococcales bacterium]|nr:hypothetical protein [Myxococcales bacterium]